MTGYKTVPTAIARPDPRRGQLYSCLTAWKLPHFLIPATSKRQTLLAGFIVMALAISVIFAWLFNHTRGSVVPALVLHTAINTWSFIVPVLPTEEIRRPYFLAACLMVLIAIALLVRPSASAPGKAAQEQPA